MKKLLASVLAVVMLLCMGIVTTYAAEEDVILTVTPNITTAETGAAVDVFYTIKIKPNNGVKVGAFSFNLVEADKMTLSTAKATSQGGDGYWVAKLKYDEEYNADGIFETVFAYTVDSKYFAAAGGTNERCLTSETVVMTIKATIAEGEVGEFALNASNFTVSDPLGNEITGTSVKTTPVVVSRAPVHATGIKLNKSELALASGAEGTLSATVTPNDSIDTVTWESSDSTIASVDENGKVTAHKVGTAVITATAGTKSANCTVTVTCGHNLGDDYPAVESTCTVAGHDAYSQCGECGQLFDKDGKEISEIPFRPLAAHKGGTATCKDKAVCSVCNQPYGDFADHNYVEKAEEQYLKSAATCNAPAVYYKSCSVCGAKSTETFEYGNVLPNENAPVVTVERKSGKIGNTVLVTVSLDKNPGIWGMDLVVNYDKTQLTLTGVTNGTVFSESEWTPGNLSSDKYILSYEASGFDDIAANGVLATLEFTVNETATVDTFSNITVSYNVGDIINVNFDDIDVVIVGGGIDIIDFIYGDLNGDGLVNKKDSLLMKMYLADNTTVIDMRAADVYLDGSINKKDSLYLKQYLAGLDVELGA